MVRAKSNKKRVPPRPSGEENYEDKDEADYAEAADVGDEEEDDQPPAPRLPSRSNSKSGSRSRQKASSPKSIKSSATKGRHPHAQGNYREGGKGLKAKPARNADIYNGKGSSVDMLSTAREEKKKVKISDLRSGGKRSQSQHTNGDNHSKGGNSKLRKHAHHIATHAKRKKAGTKTGGGTTTIASTPVIKRQPPTKLSKMNGVSTTVTQGVYDDTNLYDVSSIELC